MSHDEIRIAKRALIVWSGAAALVPIAAIGWYAHVAISNIEAKANASIARVADSVVEVRLAQERHESKDDQRYVNGIERVSRLETQVEQIMARTHLDALPPERRRLRLGGQ